MKSLIPFLLVMLAPLRKALRTVLDKRVAPMVRHVLSGIGLWLVNREVIDNTQAEQITNLTDIVMGCLFFGLAIVWSYIEKKLNPLKAGTATVSALLIACGIIALLPSCAGLKNGAPRVADLIAPVVNRAKAAGYGVRCIVTGEEICLCAGKNQAKTEPATAPAPAK